MKRQDRSAKLSTPTHAPPPASAFKPPTPSQQWCPKTVSKTDTRFQLGRAFEQIPVQNSPNACRPPKTRSKLKPVYIYGKFWCHCSFVVLHCHTAFPPRLPHTAAPWHPALPSLTPHPVPRFAQGEADRRKVNQQAAIPASPGSQEQEALSAALSVSKSH